MICGPSQTRLIFIYLSILVDNAATTISPGDEFQSSHFGFNVSYV